MEQLVLTHVTNDDFDRPVYKDKKGNIFKDVDPREFFQPNICTASSIDREPDTPIQYIKKYQGVEIVFVPYRITW